LSDFFGQNKDSDVFAFSVPFQDGYIFINDTASLEYILNTNFNNYIKGRLFSDRMTEMFGHGIFNVDGKQWYLERKVASKIFTSNRFKEMFETVFPQTMNKFLARIESISSEPMDMHNMLHQYFLDSFAKVAFGVIFN
jgi:cytochrome P450